MARTPPVPSATVKQHDADHARQGVDPDEWAKHGTCSGLSIGDYFGLIEKLYNGLEVPEEFKKPANSARTSPSVVEQKFATANNAPKGAFRVSCPQNRFSAGEICLSKDFQYPLKAAGETPDNML